MTMWLSLTVALVTSLGALPQALSYSTEGNFAFLAAYYTELGVPNEIEIQFMPNIQIQAGDVITVTMPGFTTMDRKSMIVDGVSWESYRSSYKNQYQYGDADFLYTMTTIFEAQWTEGELNESNFPANYMQSKLELRVRTGRVLTPGTLFTVVIYKETGIQPFCGTVQLTGNPDDYFKWNFIRFSTDATDSDGETQKVMYTNQVGSACLDRESCSGHGYCEFCRSRCICDEGYGNPSDITQMGAQQTVVNQAHVDCSERICPKGVSNYVPVSANSAVEVQECSNQGLCDRSSGECKCFTGFEGAACEKRSCPRSCSGHGRCLPIRELAQSAEATPLSSTTTEYGTLEKLSNVAWDHDVSQGCLCDSSWTVGLGAGEVQDSEWFGPDCSLRRCPSGDDPLTELVDETDCSGKQAQGGVGVGQTGNICHLDCSGRGICDHKQGTCSCFKGFGGENCAVVQKYQT